MSLKVTQRIPQKALTSSREVEESKALVDGANFIPTSMNTRPQLSCRFGLVPVLASVAGGTAVTDHSAVCRAPPHHVGFVSVEAVADTRSLISST
jgi:hypothetical protein